MAAVFSSPRKKMIRLFAGYALLLMLLFLAIVALGGSRFRKFLYARLNLDTLAMYYGYFAILVTIFLLTYYVTRELARTRDS